MLSRGLALMLLVSATAAAERLPVRVYSSGSGLTGDDVWCLLNDSRGMLWVGTSTGLSRFDGESFVNYTREDGLESLSVSAIAEDRRGRIWLGTGAGVARLRERRDGARAFDNLPLPTGEAVNDMLVARDGSVYVTSASMLLVRSEAEDRFLPVDLGVPWPAGSFSRLTGLSEGSDGSLWVRGTFGVIRRAPDGTAAVYAAPVGDLVLADHSGIVWLDSGRILMAFRPGPMPADGQAEDLLAHARVAPCMTPEQLPGLPGEVVVFGPAAGFSESIRSLHRSADGTMWIGGSRLLAWDETAVQRYDSAKGLPGRGVTALLEDGYGGLWIGTESGGLVRFDRRGFRGYGPPDGLMTDKVSSLIEGPDGRLLAVSFPPEIGLHRLDVNVFTAFRFPPETQTEPLSWGENQATLRDRAGEWWVPTAHGLFRYPAVPVEELERAHPIGRYGAGNGLGADEVFRLFEDSLGDIWIGTFGFQVRMARFDRAHGRFVQYVEQDGVPFDTPSAFAEDACGTVWIGFYHGGVARYRDGAFRFLPPGGPLPPGFVSSLLVDRSGRLWVGTLRGGVLCAEDPDAPSPAWRTFSERDGLATDRVLCLTEDRDGQIWIGTSRGLDRLDPRTGAMRHFDSASGLISNDVIAARFDRHGELWLATAAGVARFRPPDGAGQKVPPPGLALAGIRVAGVALDLPELGVERFGPVRVADRAAGLEVEVMSVNLMPSQSLRYQVRLDQEAWSPGAHERRVHYAGLPLGRHRLEVRALRSDGVASAPVEVLLDVPPPLWRRWWVILSTALVVAAVAVLSHRRRIARITEVHRVRARIAADLHDELGLSLARISMLAAVAGRRSPLPELSEIGTAARDLIDSTSDMVWALDPRRDDLPSLLARLRRLVSDVFEGSSVDWTFEVASQIDSLALGAEHRRHLYLILKEAINNAARHADASRVSVTLALSGGRLRAEVADDGRGFDPSAGSEGNGMTTMARRAAELGADLRVESDPGRGTRVCVEMPVEEA